MDVSRFRTETIAAVKKILNDAAIEIPSPYRTLTLENRWSLNRLKKKQIRKTIRKQKQNQHREINIKYGVKMSQIP